MVAGQVQGAKSRGQEQESCKRWDWADVPSGLHDSLHGVSSSGIVIRRR